MLSLGAYDLLLSDTKMPVLDGQGLFEEIGRRFPAMRRRMMFLTADVMSREKRDFLERSGVPSLAKPCDLGEVRRLVRELLASMP
jgi:CheY-like chemotaxis protein